MRLIKSTLQATFPDITGAVTRTHTEINNGVPISKVKSSTTARSSTVVLADDPDLVASSLAAGTYEFELMLFVTGTITTAQGLKYVPAFSGTVGTVAYWGASSSNASSTLRADAAGQFTQTSLTAVFGDLGAGGATDYVYLRGMFVASTSGNFSIQWAQNSSNTNATNVKAGSYLKLTRLA